jgi:hypothetical protein
VDHADAILDLIMYQETVKNVLLEQSLMEKVAFYHANLDKNGMEKIVKDLVIK